MSEDPRELKLRALFQAQREADVDAARTFHRMWAAAQAEAGARSVPHRLLRWAVPVAVAVAATVFVVLRPPPEADLGELLVLAQELGEWEAPLDFLLERPGMELLEADMNFGESLSGDEFDMNLEIEERTQS
jgi:hypothetical protein